MGSPLGSSESHASSAYDADIKGRSLSLPGPGPDVGAWPGRQALTAPVTAWLTVDVTCVPPFEAALQIVEFVRALEVERDIQLCSGGGSAARTPGQGLEMEEEWTPLPPRGEG